MLIFSQSNVLSYSLLYPTLSTARFGVWRVVPYRRLRLEQHTIRQLVVVIPSGRLV
jgi:hypothetical protein